MKAVILITLFITLISFGSAVHNFEEVSNFGYNNLDGPMLSAPINYSELPTVNSSDFWNTDIGVLNTVNATQFNNILQVLNLDESWLNTKWLNLDQSNFGFDSPYLSYSKPNFDFNEVLLNATIDDKIRSIEYNATSFEVPAGAGTIDAGNLFSIQVAGDGDWLNISEDSGVIPNLDLIVNFTGIENFNSVQFDIWYQDGGGHEIGIGVWDCDDDEYEFEYQPNIVDMDNLARLARNVLDPSSHICGADKNVSVIFSHLNIGNQNHDFHMDDIKLISGAPVSSPVEVDPLAIHSSGDVPWMGNENGNGFNSSGWNWVNADTGNFTNLLVVGNMIGNLNMGGYNVTNATLVNMSSIIVGDVEIGGSSADIFSTDALSIDAIGGVNSESPWTITSSLIVDDILINANTIAKTNTGNFLVLRGQPTGSPAINVGVGGSIAFNALVTGWTATGTPFKITTDNNGFVAGVGEDLIISSDGTNPNYTASGSAVHTFYNSTGLGTIRAGRYITGSNVPDVNSNNDFLSKLDNIADWINPDGSINYLAHSAGVKLPQKDENNCFQVIDKYCLDPDCWESSKTEPKDVEFNITYREECGTKLVDGLDLEQRASDLEGMVFELREENNLIKGCASSSKDFAEYKLCVGLL